MVEATKRDSNLGVPVDEVKELLTKVERGHVRINRKNDRGQLCYLHSQEIPITDLLSIEPFLIQLGGGGHYVIDVRNINDYTQLLMKSFQVVIEGLPLPVNKPGGPGQTPTAVLPAVVPHANGGGASMSEGMPPWMAGGASSWVDAYRRRGYGAAAAPGATVASDELAMKQAAKLEAAVARLEAELLASRQKYESDVLRLRDENAKLHADMIESRQKAEMRALESRLEAALSAPKDTGPKIDLAGIAAILAGVAPMVQAMVSSNAEKQSLALKAQQEGMQQLMQATLSQANRDGGLKEMLTTFGPLLVPIVQQFMGQRDPEKQAALYEAMANTNLNQFAMIAQLIEAQSASMPEPPAWMALLQQALGSAVAMAEKYTTTPGGLPGQRQAPPELPRPVGVVQTAKAVQPAPGAPVQYVDDQNVPRRLPPNAEALLRFLPEDLQGNGWEEFLRHLHSTPQWSPQWLGEGLAELIVTGVENDTLPKTLGGLVQEGADYRAILLGSLERVPAVLERPRYVEEVVDVAVAELHRMVNEAQAEDESQGTQEAETPSAREELRASAPNPTQVYVYGSQA